MAFCSNCCNQIGDNTLFCPVCGHRVGVVVRVQEQQPFQLSQQNDKPLKPDSNMALAILSTVICCVPTGIYAIILSNKVETLYYEGDYKAAEYAAEDSKKWSIIGIALAFIMYIIVFFVYLIVIFSID